MPLAGIWGAVWQWRQVKELKFTFALLTHKNYMCQWQLSPTQNHRKTFGVKGPHALWFPRKKGHKSKQLDALRDKRRLLWFTTCPPALNPLVPRRRCLLHEADQQTGLLSAAAPRPLNPGNPPGPGAPGAPALPLTLSEQKHQYRQKKKKSKINKFNSATFF